MVEGEFSPESAYLYAYGIYLMNGGTPDGFLDFNVDDVQILLSSYTCTQMGKMKQISRMISSMFGESE